jgi:hypothetical protein
MLMPPLDRLGWFFVRCGASISSRRAVIAKKRYADDLTGVLFFACSFRGDRLAQNH